ncbi:MAG: SxtJ family membrane protein [Candidatus Omnitrophota bacterium]|nr:SxtJ family membrane protein [Candidatus Omnitrophota bacterium]
MKRSNALNWIELRRFGFSLGLGLNILGCVLFYRHREHFIWFSGIGSIALILAVLRPIILAPLKKVLDKLIFIIGWVTSVLSLLIAFYLIFTPIALLLKVFGKDLLNQKVDKTAGTYWIKRKNASFSKGSYERMG